MSKRSFARLSVVAMSLALLATSACHGSLYAMHHEHMNTLCSNPQAAYEHGYNAGMKRTRMDSSWVSSNCIPERQEEIANAYLEGYDAGAEHAPAVVVATTQSTPASAGLQSCTFSSDCGDDMSCRAWGNSGNVCMGYGDNGDPCWFSSDCLSGSCRMQSGTTAKICQ